MLTSSKNGRSVFNPYQKKRKLVFQNEVDRVFPPKLKTGIKNFKKLHSSDLNKDLATRKASEICLELINATYNNTIGGSADLTGSNNTKTSTLETFSEDNRSGRYIHYGIREHAMGAIMNGVSLHGGFIPYGGTFLYFLLIIAGLLLD